MGSELCIRDSFRTASQAAGKAVLRWEKGVYVGRSEKADDILYLTERGLSRTNAFRLVTEEERWDKIQEPHARDKEADLQKRKGGKQACSITTDELHKSFHFP